MLNGDLAERIGITLSYECNVLTVKEDLAEELLHFWIHRAVRSISCCDALVEAVVPHTDSASNHWMFLAVLKAPESLISSDLKLKSRIANLTKLVNMLSINGSKRMS